MRLKPHGPYLWLALAFVLFLAGLGGALSLRGGEDDFVAAVIGLAALFLVAVWKIIDATLIGPIGRLAVDLAAAARGEQRGGIDPARFAALRTLPQAANALLADLNEARGRTSRAVAAATAAAETEKARLAAILHELHEGVVVCNWQHQVVLYNQAALDLLHVSGEMGLGRPLFGLVAKDPVLHILDGLRRRPDGPGHAPFITGTTDGRSLLQGRISLIRRLGEGSGYVVTVSDVTESVSALAHRDALLRELIETLEGPVQRLNDQARDPAQAAADISSVLERAVVRYRSLLVGWWPMTDIRSADLFDLVIQRLDGSGLAVTMTGLPVWLHGDSHSLVLALAALLPNIAGGTGAREFDLWAESDGRFGWICVSWQGARVDDASLMAWQKGQVSPALGGMTVRDVMSHHTREDLVEEARGGVVTLRIALFLGREGQDRLPRRERLPSRPEFFDFNLLAQEPAGSLGKVRLRQLTYVVFDTETTGLRPTQGDEVVSIGAVRVVNGRILTGETFNRVVDPGRPIPAESVIFHGITDEMVVGKPPLPVVLPQFRAYVADAVLVAHNAAFDLKFIRLREGECGVSFDNPVLDTMLLSSYVDGTPDNQSLDAIAERYGIALVDRHSALGDSLVTAAVLLRLIDGLEAKGIVTLDDAMTTLNMTMELHNRGLML